MFQLSLFFSSLTESVKTSANNLSNIVKINITTKPSIPPFIYSKISAELNETKLNNTKSKLIRPNKNEKIKRQ